MDRDELEEMAQQLEAMAAKLRAGGADKTLVDTIPGLPSSSKKRANQAKQPMPTLLAGGIGAGIMVGVGVFVVLLMNITRHDPVVTVTPPAQPAPVVTIVPPPQPAPAVAPVETAATSIASAVVSISAPPPSPPPAAPAVGKRSLDRGF